MDNTFYAHISEDGRTQTVSEHLEGTARLSAEFAAAFEEKQMGYLLGLAHDIGKYTAGFQRRLQGGPKVDHSSAGMFELMKLSQFGAAFCVAGHHGGIPDGGGQGDSHESGTFMGRRNKVLAGKIEDYSKFHEAVALPKVPLKAGFGENLLADCFWVRMLFSCLVDADYLDTERFMEGNRETSEQDKSGWANPADMEELERRLQEYISGWFPPKNLLNEMRCGILEECIRKGQQEKPGLFSLTVPTGGGKTVASLAFAIHHAKAQGKKRIIYVIPYTSIIEQTADVFRKILGEEYILEHHSGVLYEDEGGVTEETLRKIKAVENWDMPVIVTTAVQFFESMYSNRPSKCRKLHNMADSVIVFDEAQMLPIPYLRPCVHGIAQLVERYHATAVLCTATQPALERIFKQFLPECSAVELCPARYRKNDIFRRVTFVRAGKLTWEALGEALREHRQVLCIVNSRKNAGQVYQLLDREGAFHLSTLMYPEHRRGVLAEIRRRLKAGEVCRVVATSLIEAGVDVDFPAVYREEAGLDSILQAAGRCNREGKRSGAESIVTIFQAENRPPQLFAIPIGAARSVLMHREDIASEEAIHEYFVELLDLQGEDAQDRKQILKRLQGGDFPFQSVAEDFKLIENDGETIYIPTERNRDLISRLRQGERSRALFRELGQYGVSVYRQHFDALYQAGDLELLDEEAVILVNENLYSAETGLSLEADYGKALFI